MSRNSPLVCLSILMVLVSGGTQLMTYLGPGRLPSPADQIPVIVTTNSIVQANELSPTEMALSGIGRLWFK